MDNICKIHNEPAIFCEQNEKEQLVYLCQTCLQQKFKIKNINDVNNQQKQSLNQLELKYDSSIKQLKDFVDQLQQFTQQIQSKLQKIKQQVDQNISYIVQKQQQVKNISQGFSKLQLNQINEEENILNNQFTQIKEQLNNQLKELDIITKIDKLYTSLNNLSIDSNKREIGKDENKKKLIIIEKQFNYQLIQSSSYKQNEQCSTIAFNKDATIMVAGCEKMIKVFEFKGDKINQVQQLNGHSEDVNCLLFMKSNQFISGSNDKTMIIWEHNKNNLWQSNQFLKGHTSLIQSITINYNEDLMISGSFDKTIKFWYKQNNFWSLNQSINSQSEVYSISLSDNEDKAIAILYDKSILVINLQDKQWIIKQKIPVEIKGLRLCFIKQDQFVFQPKQGQHLQIFNFDPKDQTFQKAQELQYVNQESDHYDLFPIRYIPQIGLLMVKHGNHIHLIKRSQDGQFKVEQSINFGTKFLYGGITDDGRYIVTWDDKSNEIQIRKFDY